MAGIFAVAIVASSVPLAPYTKMLDSISITASAAETEDGLMYEENEEGTLTITGYTGTGGDVVIPSTIDGASVTSIGANAFIYCDNLSKVSIPASVTSIGEYTFCQCISLSEVTIPDSVTSIGVGAFAQCESLSEVTIPDSVTKIGESAFEECYSLTSVTIGNSVTSIGEWAFYNCGVLAEITIPDSVKSIGANAFAECPDLKNVYYTGSESDWESVSIEDGNDALKNATITYVKAAQKILDSELTWEIDENGVLTISGLDEAFPDFWVDDEPIEWCDKKADVKEVVFDTPNLKNLGGAAFYEFPMTKITLPSTLTSIDEYAFAYCSSLPSVTIPDSVTSIDDSAFGACSALTEITIPDSVTSIGNNAFIFCSSLSSVTIPNSVTSIGLCAFTLCTSLRSVIIPNSVEYIGPGVFMYCEALTDVVLPDSIAGICDQTFDHCSALTLISIPDSVTSIGEGAFNSTALTEVTIPASLTSISMGAFADCSALTEVTFECDDADAIASFNSIGNSDIFMGCTELKTIYVPVGCVDAYKNSEGYQAALGDYMNLIQEKSTVEAMGASVSYDGDVTINFHYLVSNSYKNGYVKFGDDLVVNVSEASIDKDGYYVFPISMPAKNMYDEITAQFYDEEGTAVGEKVEFTLTGYMKEVKEYDPNYSDFVDSFLEYGKQAAAYFDVSGAPAGKTYTEDDYNKISEALAAYATVDMDEHFVGATLLLKSVPKLRLYYDNDTAVEDLEASDNNPGLYYVEQEFKPSNFQGNLNGYSVYNYIYKALQTGSDELKPLCAALYNLSSQFN